MEKEDFATSILSAETQTGFFPRFLIRSLFAESRKGTSRSGTEMSEAGISAGRSLVSSSAVHACKFLHLQRPICLL